MFCWKMYNLNVLVKLKNRLKHEVAMNKKRSLQPVRSIILPVNGCTLYRSFSGFFIENKNSDPACVNFFKLHVCSWFWSWPKKSIFLLPLPFFRCVYCACRMCYWFPFSYECTDLLWLFSMDWIKYCAVSSGGSAHPPGSSHSVCRGLGRW